MNQYDPQRWRELRQPDPEKEAAARKILEEIRAGSEVAAAVRRNPVKGQSGYIAKHVLVSVYRKLVASGEWPADEELLRRIRMKPVRSLSGVTTVTVLTKPYPCPGECIFCPSDVRMPKSYLPDEPGAARAFQNQFDPYLQVHSRLSEYHAIGHPVDKIELLILGGTFSAYPRSYQEMFIRRVFDAMNGRDAPDLATAQVWNESAAHRNVGLVVETRPDEISAKELIWLRQLGVTKVQIGVQSLDERILALNKRKHTAGDTLKAAGLLRAAGFKIVAHWMPNLLGATLESDRADFARLWETLCPDELKIYPTQLLEGTELYERWRQGEFQPYTTEELVALIADLKPSIPPYCRVNRVIRDIPSTHVVAGNKRTSLRQDVLAELKRRGTRCGCIRCHEVKGTPVRPELLRLEETIYPAGAAEEHFLHLRTPEDQIAGYLRLSLPGADSPALGLSELEGAALIREVHVYGQAVSLGDEQPGAAQHSGLGRRLIEAAAARAKSAGYSRLGVIAAIGTRNYYRRHGFEVEGLYMTRAL